MRLDGKTAILTGAAGTIGRATAEVFAREGARLVLVDRDQERLDSLAARLDPTRCAALSVDVTDPNAMPKAIELAEARFGAFHIFFANSGVEGISAEIEAYPSETYDLVMDANVKSVFLGIQAALSRIADGGSIILTSSIMGLMGSAKNIAYTASKHAVVGLRRSAASAAGHRGVRVNSLHPGYVESEMLSRLMTASGDPAGARARYQNKAKLARLVAPREVADAVLFLASDESSAITNQSLAVDAGVLD